VDNRHIPRGVSFSVRRRCGRSALSLAVRCSGKVKWFGRWRQYVFAPAANTVWNPDCLNEVSRFVVKCTVDHQLAAAARARI